jgi:hypothetical protein
VFFFNLLDFNTKQKSKMKNLKTKENIKRLDKLKAIKSNVRFGTLEFKKELIDEVS